MKIHYEVPLFSQVVEAIKKAKQENKQIDYIGLTSQEFNVISYLMAYSRRLQDDRREGWILGVKILEEN